MSKQFVYVLKNGEVPPRYYTGIAADVTKRRLPQRRLQRDPAGLAHFIFLWAFFLSAQYFFIL